MQQSEKEPDFNNPPHQLPSLYATAMVLLCYDCGYWEVVEDVWEGDHWRSERTLPCDCQVCNGQKTVHVVDDDDSLCIRLDEIDVDEVVGTFEDVFGETIE